MLIEEELALVERAKTGDQSALSMLWDKITPKLYGYLINKIRNKQLAEDILQDTWVKAIGAIHSFRPKGVRFSAWLFAIARNECCQKWRKDGREISIEENLNIHQNTESPDQLINKITLDTAFKQLPIEDQEVLSLRFISELSFKEIAYILGTSIISSRVRVHRALKRAQNILKQ